MWQGIGRLASNIARSCVRASLCRDCLVAEGKGAGKLSQSLAPSSDVMNKLLQYIWSLWEDPIDASALHSTLRWLLIHFVSAGN